VRGTPPGHHRVPLPRALGGGGVGALGHTRGDGQVAAALRVARIAPDAGGAGGERVTAHARFASYDAAYVLGALSPRDRQEFEQHLRECAECAQGVRELAGMPGLLAKVPGELVTDPEGDG